MAGASSAARPHYRIQVPGLIEQASPIVGVRLWLVDLDEPTREAADSWLSPSEQERAARFVFPRDARRYRAAHAALRWLLAQHCGLPARSEFDLGAHGKPHIGGHTAGGFNLSHSGGRALIGIGIGIGSGDGLGVDIELLRTVDDVWPVAEQNFSADVYAALRRTPPADVAHAFLSVWTRKEACLKAAGIGLNLLPASFEVGLGAERKRTTLATGQGSIELLVQAVMLGAGMLAAVANTLAPPPHDGSLR
jgi:4'-phosphopantetheinyl transferase